MASAERLMIPAFEFIQLFPTQRPTQLPLLVALALCREDLVGKDRHQVLRSCQGLPFGDKANNLSLDSVLGVVVVYP